MLDTFKTIWVLDFEFLAPDGSIPAPVCLVAHELRTGQRIRLWRDELLGRTEAPFPVDVGSLAVTFYASAEWGCFLALGWPLPANVLDLFAEFRNLTNGQSLPSGCGLLGALVYYGIDGIGAAEKADMRKLIMGGGPWTAEERAGILEYCESDVVATARLFQAMRPRLDWPRALLRGRYTKAVGRIEHSGVPMDQPQLAQLRERWGELQERLIVSVDRDFGVFDGTVFKRDRWAGWLARHGIPWPMLESGELDLKDDTFKEMALAFPAVAPIRELRATLGQMRLSDLAVGPDGRNRTLLSPFGNRQNGKGITGRNQPSTTKFVFGPAVWIRGLIQPPPGFGLAYVDWSQQEFGIAAALSQDPAMLDAYSSGDPYLAFAKQAGAVPLDATKKTHGKARDLFKAAVLAVQYGMGAESLALRIGQPPAKARELLDLHKRVYRVFWRWSDGALHYAGLYGRLWTVFGWTLHTFGPAGENARSLRNWPMQSTGSELLRLACCVLTEQGIGVVAPVHDAVLIEAPLAELDAAIRQTQATMARASSTVLGGFELASDAKIVRFPDRYMDERGAAMWARVQELLASPGPVET